MKPPFYGWYVVAYAVVAQMIVIGTTLSSFGLYVVPVSESFNLSRADMNTVLVMLNLGGAVLSPVVGWVIDRYPIRKLLIIGALMAGFSMAALGLSGSILLSAVIIALFVTTGDALATRPGSALIVRWFQQHRGRALALGAFGLSLGSIVGAPMVGFFIQTFGWRISLMLSGALITAIVLIPGLVLRMQPSEAERQREGMVETAGAVAGGAALLSVPSLLRMPQFWCIGLAIAIPMAVSQSVLVAMVPMAVQHGVTPPVAATLVSASGLMAITSKIVLSIFADRINRSLLLASVFCIAAIENVVLFLLAGQAPYPVLLGCALLQGFTSGLLMPVWTALVAERFGARSYATVFGLMYPIILVMCALLVRFSGEVYDRTGGYQFAFATFVVLEIVAAVLMFSVRFTRAVTPAVPAALIDQPAASV